MNKTKRAELEARLAAAEARIAALESKSLERSQSVASVYPRAQMPSVSGYTCAICGKYVSPGLVHQCFSVNTVNANLNETLSV